MQKTVIIGAGITGLSCAYFLKKPYILLEKESIPGGLCRSFYDKGFTFDFSGHFIHLRNEEIKRLLFRLLKNNITKIDRKAWIYEFERLIPYPFQANLYYLPEKEKLECIKTFIKKKTLKRKTGSLSFLDWSNSAFGKGITSYFMKPYNEKLWTVSAKTLTADWVGPFVPEPKFAEIKNGAFKPQEKRFGYNASFYYPKKNGCQALIDAFIKNTGNISYNTGSHSIDTDNGLITLDNGSNIEYDDLVSTQPLPRLLSSIKGLPSSISAEKDKLKWNSVLCLNIGTKDDNITGTDKKDVHWMYFPESRYPFYRIGIYSSILPSLAPKGKNSFYVEVSLKSGSPLNKAKLTRNVLRAMKELGLISSENAIKTINYAFMPCAYVIYDRDRTEAVALIHEYLRSKNIYSIGRYGAWKYSFIEESISDAKKTAELINKL